MIQAKLVCVKYEILTVLYLLNVTHFTVKYYYFLFVTCMTYLLKIKNENCIIIIFIIYNL